MARLPSGDHGSTAYAQREKCKCSPCRTAVRRMSKRSALAAARGETHRVPAEPLRRHVQSMLTTYGITRRQFSTAAGVADTVTKHLLEGTREKPPATFVLRATADKYLSVTPAQAMGQTGFVPNVGIIRRLQAMEMAGYSRVQVSVAMGMARNQTYNYSLSDKCFTETINRIDAIYREYTANPGDNARTLWGARFAGHVPASSWEELDIDDPEATPWPPACVVSHCTREVSEHNLCVTHLRAAKTRARGQLTHRSYRLAVQWIDHNMRTHDAAQYRQDLAEFKALGMTAEATAMRLGRPLTYIDKIWSTL